MHRLQEHLLVPVHKPEDQHEEVVVHAPNEPLRIIPFAFSYLHLVLYVVVGVASGGLVFILSVWYPHVFTFLARTQLPLSSAANADYVLILVYGKGLHAQWLECRVNRSAENNANDAAKTPWIWFEFKKHRYVYSIERGEFRRYLATIQEDLGAMKARIDSGLANREVNSRIEHFGANKVLIEKPRVPVLLFRKLVAPFYIFQVISAIIWFFEAYTVYAVIIVCLSALSITNEIYVEVSNSNRLRSLVRSDHRIPVVRAGITAEIHESELVPGDIVELKEGTLTQEHLSFVGVDDPKAVGVPTLSIPPQVKLVMATCHSLSEHEGELQGYPLELAMFNASHYSMEYINEKVKGSFIAMVTTTEDETSKYGVLKRFAFDATHQRSSTIIEEVETKKRFVVVKGSPEAISAISVSTPADLQQKVHSYSADGYYCIGFGMKELVSSSTPIDTINREEVECAVEFQGVAIFKNELKPETRGMLDELAEAKIDVRIITVFKDYDMEALEYSYEDTTTWLFVHFSYIVVAIAFNVLKDRFRLPFYTNRIFTTLVISALGVNLWFLLDTSGVINNTFQVMPIPASFRCKLLLLFLAELFLASGWEFVATRTLPEWFAKRSKT
ncbi:P-type ATPase (P-ATPase) Superfamily [Phytophthora cinnamomi]|uniref:P-type ATPase (P-ATPase) Superfamily n=1 Tax=Phytophthora cinnamomi TaxID=4785 RepID=UPI00355AC3A7|nr:P-type ATPase (P-ATPase) Superfamily [Phytophthora cinnamomi]